MFKNSYRAIFVLFFVVSIIYSKAQLPQFGWAAGMGGTSMEIGNAIAVDDSGNVYTTGTFSGTVDFDPGIGVANLSSAGKGDVFVSKLDASGNFLWAKRVGGTDDDQGYALAFDKSGNIHVTGNFKGTSDFDPGPGIFNLNSVGYPDVFIFKLDASGNYVWAKTFGGIGSCTCRAITIDASGFIYATGGFQGIIDFDPDPGTFTLSSTPPSNDIFLLKLNASGNFNDAFAIGNVFHDEGVDVSVDAIGFLYHTVRFEGTVDLNPGVASFSIASNYPSLAIIKYDLSGNFLWAKGVTGSSNIIGNSSCVDSNGNIYTTGLLIGNADFDPGPGSHTLTANGSNDSFVLKLDSSGNFLWASNVGSVHPCVGNSIAVDKSGSAYTVGFFNGTVDFDPGPGIFTLTAGGSYGDIFISKLESNGNFAWARSMKKSYVTSVAVDKSKSVYSTGWYQETVDFDPNQGIYNLSSVFSSDIFVLKLDTCPNPQQPIDLTPLANKIICQNQTTTLSASGIGTINWYLSPSSTVIVNTGTTFIVQPANSGTLVYYVEDNSCSSGFSRTAITLTVSNCVGLDNSFIQNSEFEIFPNPSSDFVNLKCALDISSLFNKILFYNSLGQKVLEENLVLKNNKAAFSISDFENGIYFLELKNPSGQTLKKRFVVHH